jgi:hypothetical protein
MTALPFDDLFVKVAHGSQIFWADKSVLPS